MNYRISGIPCTIRLDNVHGEHKPARIYGDPDDCYEEQFPEVEFTVCDRNGRPAPWLEKKMTMAESMEIEAMLLEQMEECDEF